MRSSLRPPRSFQISVVRPFTPLHLYTTPTTVNRTHSTGQDARPRLGHHGWAGALLRSMGFGRVDVETAARKETTAASSLLLRHRCLVRLPSRKRRASQGTWFFDDGVIVLVVVGETRWWWLWPWWMDKRRRAKEGAPSLPSFLTRRRFMLMNATTTIQTHPALHTHA